MKMKSVDVWTKLDSPGAVITNLISQRIRMYTGLKSSILISQILQFRARFCRNCKHFSYMESCPGAYSDRFVKNCEPWKERFLFLKRPHS